MKKKSLVGWTYKVWRDTFNFNKYSHHGEMDIPEIVSNKKWWLPSNTTKVRITIEELR